jgi:hypothetical protein
VGNGTGSFVTALKNTGTAGTYRSVTTDAQGRVISGTNPTTISGYGITDAVTKVTSTDNAVVRFDGTTGQVQNSRVIIDDNGSVGIGTNSPLYLLDVRNTSTTGTSSDNAIMQLKSSNRNCAYLMDTIGGTYSGSITNYTSGVIKSQLLFDSAGNILSILPNGGLGYGTGSGGTVTQLTSKSTVVTLNKPTGQITMNNAALAAGAEVDFVVNNNLVTTTDAIYPTIPLNSPNNGSYTVRANQGLNGFYLCVKNISGGSLSDAVIIDFKVIKGAIS